MISHAPHKVVFVHIPKCAGTSVESALATHLGDCRPVADIPDASKRLMCLPTNAQTSGRAPRQHWKLADYECAFDLSKHVIFSVVRNPWDRAVSQISYLCDERGSSAISGSNFKDRLYSYCCCKATVHGQDLSADQLAHLKSHCGYEDSTILLRFETLACGFRAVCDAIGIPTPHLPHLTNSIGRIHYSRYYDEESRLWVEQRFQRDIKRFNYEFLATGP